MKIVPCLTLLLGAVISCTAPAFNQSEVEQEVRNMLKSYHQAMETNGLEAEFDFLDNSDDFFWVPPGYTSTLTYDSVRTILKQTAPAIDSISLSWETLSIYPLSRDLASYSGIVSGTMRDTSGNINAMHLIESGTCIRRADGWKLLNGQSAVLPEK
ncbi:MAG: nuclear transport factor 2 family protein [Saprospiraceae bacterium]